MPSGVYERSAEVRAQMSVSACRRGISARLNSPDARTKAEKARKLARVRRSGYLAVGRRTEKVRTLHRVRAERALGKPLVPTVHIHHPDEDPLNPEARLVICQDSAYHQLLHFRMRIKAAGGNPNTDRLCSRCKAVKPSTEFNVNRGRKADGLDSFCRNCIREKNAIQRARRLGVAV